MRQPSNDRVAEVFDRDAGRYDRQMGRCERLLFAGSREWAVARAHGTVVELGVGTGLNLPLYGPAVERIIGVDVSEAMLEIARRRTEERGIGHVELQRGDAQALDLAAGVADTVLSTFTFCTIPDPLAASREAYRVLRPGGRFVLAEHGPSTFAAARAVMRAVEPLSVRFAADHLMRDPVPFVASAGFAVDEVHRAGVGGIAFRVLAHREPASSG